MASPTRQLSLGARNDGGGVSVLDIHLFAEHDSANHFI
jgi:hypothetical protein